MAKRKWTQEEVTEYRRTHSSFIYFNKDDANLFIQKDISGRWALNYANPISWLFIVAIIALIIGYSFI